MLDYSVAELPANGGDSASSQDPSSSQPEVAASGSSRSNDPDILDHMIERMQREQDERIQAAGGDPSLLSPDADHSYAAPAFPGEGCYMRTYCAVVASGKNRVLFLRLLPFLLPFYFQKKKRNKIHTCLLLDQCALKLKRLKKCRPLLIFHVNVFKSYEIKNSNYTDTP